MECPKLIIKTDDDRPTKGMCSLCRAIFPTLDGTADANMHLLEAAFREHVAAEHSDSLPPWETEQRKLQ